MLAVFLLDTALRAELLCARAVAFCALLRCLIAVLTAAALKRSALLLGAALRCALYCGRLLAAGLDRDYCPLAAALGAAARR
jgi:hypothetical protein